MSERRRRTGLVGWGIGLVVLAVVVVVTAAVLGYGAVERTVKGFARAPVGCTTTVEFHRAATFTLFVETKGRLAELDGDCGARPAYARRDDDLPSLSVSVVSDDGGTVALGDTTTDDYDLDGYVGRAYASVDVAAPGTYRVTVSGDADDVVIAIGGDPNVDATWWWLGGFGAATALFLLGLVLLVMGLVGRRPAPSAPPTRPTPSAPPFPAVPSGPGPWTTLPPPPPPPPPPPGPPRGAAPDATAAGATLPPPPPPPN